MGTLVVIGLAVITSVLFYKTFKTMDDTFAGMSALFAVLTVLGFLTLLSVNESQAKLYEKTLVSCKKATDECLTGMLNIENRDKQETLKYIYLHNKNENKKSN